MISSSSKALHSFAHQRRGRSRDGCGSPLAARVRHADLRAPPKMRTVTPSCDVTVGYAFLTKDELPLWP
eukprot:6144714-Prymnesium_polylepis.1